MYIIYGLPNCETVRKAIKWMKDQDHSFQLHDFKKEGISEKQIAGWSAQVGTNPLLNKKSTTWRSLTEKEQAIASTEKGAIKLMANHPTLIKRPVVEQGGKIIAVGFPAPGFGI